MQLITDRLDIGTVKLDNHLKTVLQRINEFTRFRPVAKPKIAVFHR